MKVLRKIATLPLINKFLLNRYAPFRGADIRVDVIKLDDYYIRIKMPLTQSNRNVVGTHFGGSLYAMVDPFYMLILMHHLGEKYIVWDKSAQIDFLSPGRGTVYADIRLDAIEIDNIRQLAADYSPVLRTYYLNIVDDAGNRIAEVKKVLYIRRKKPSASISQHIHAA